MASRIFNKKQSLEREVKELYAKITIGATGAPTLTVGVGIESIARNSAGDYTLTLSDRYNSLKMAKVRVLSATEEDLRAQLKSETVATTKQVNFMTLTDATKTDPADGSVLIVKLDLKNVAGY